MTTVLKLGGSVITDKDRAETVDGESLERAAAAIADAVSDSTETDGGLVVVHGGGSFGHPAADAHGVTTTAGTDDAGAVTEIHAAMTALNGFVRRALLERGVEALPVYPLSLAARNREGDLALPTESVETMLEEGFVPVVQGDMVTHAGRGATVVSGDELVAELARGLDADRVGLCSTVPGVLDDERVVDRIDSLADVESVLGGSESTDVTGGMRGKVETLLGLETPASIFGLEGLEGFLAGEDVGTTVG
ncbi:isopentenyl phosphate kinase [Saliphagus infecundisoli]|uniref:Isopentenyl phosphate kinase n=1 Tax=Saliphagus infecundisoli TaxID=1849069 RepID=A0ABD5QF99_9EURY|nr:isopentenyl phosphate kinase [Saliphagus infecundisoli]